MRTFYVLMWWCQSFSAVDWLKQIPNLNKNHPTTRGITFQGLNQVWYLSNFQDHFLIINQDDIWCQRWPHPSSLQSGTINVLQVPQRPFQHLIRSIVSFWKSCSNQLNCSKLQYNQGISNINIKWIFRSVLYYRFNHTSTQITDQSNWCSTTNTYLELLFI